MFSGTRALGEGQVRTESARLCAVCSPASKAVEVGQLGGRGWVSFSIFHESHLACQAHF